MWASLEKFIPALDTETRTVQTAWLRELVGLSLVAAVLRLFQQTPRSFRICSSVLNSILQK